MSTTHTLKIDVGAVAGAMSRPLPEEIDAWLDTDSGRVHYSSATLQQTDEDLDPAMSLWIEPIDLPTRFAWARAFIEGIEVQEIRESFALACRDLQGLGTFLRLLTVHEKQHLWHTHLEHSLCQHALRWLSEHDVRPVYLVAESPEILPLGTLWDAPRPHEVKAANPGSAQRSAAHLSAMASLLHADVVIEVSGNTVTLRDRPPGAA